MMKRLLLLLTALLCLTAAPAAAELKQNPMLDIALSMLEEGNIFLTRYNKITGAQVEPHFELGLPYFFGGMHTYTNASGRRLLDARSPEYAKGLCAQSSQYFDAGKYYLYGLDCVGFTRWVYDEMGYERHPSISDMLVGNTQYHLYVKDSRSKVMPSYDQLAKHLQPGDLLAINKHGSYHIMMYIGTLSDFGFAEGDLPGLDAYLNYPLVVHCGSSFMYHDRMDRYLAEHADDPYYDNVIPPDGGVAVSIVGVPFDAAPNHGHFDVTDFAWYVLPDGYKLTLINMETVTDYCWYRYPNEK